MDSSLGRPPNLLYHIWSAGDRVFFVKKVWGEGGGHRGTPRVLVFYVRLYEGPQSTQMAAMLDELKVDVKTLETVRNGQNTCL